jgi:GAF domain-containing protein
VLDGRIGNHNADVRTDERFASLPMIRALDIGAWIGVPITLTDARLYTMCCLARESRPNLGPREVKLLAGLAESVRAELLTTLPLDA